MIYALAACATLACLWSGVEYIRESTRNGRAHHSTTED